MAALKKILGLPALILYGTGVILGAGIYSVIGVAAGAAGDALWQAFILSAVAALLTAFSYAELATMFPRAGAEYVYLREAFPKHSWASFMIGLVMAASGAATAAAVSIAFVGYLSEFIELPQLIIAPIVIAFVGGMNIVGLKASTRINGLFTLIELAGLVLCIVVGFIYGERMTEVMTASPHIGIVAGAGLVFFSYIGFENIANLAEEAKEPARDLPRAIFSSLAIVTIIYILVAVSSLALIEPEALARSPRPLIDAVSKSTPQFTGALAGAALFSTANTALINILGGSRILYGMSHCGDLPAAVGAVHSKRQTPWLAVLLTSGVALALLPLGELEEVASVASLLSLIAFLGVNLAVLTLRHSQPDTKRPFRVPLSIHNFPIIPVLAILLLIGLCFQFKPIVYGVSAITLVLTFGIWWFSSRQHKHLASK